MHAYNIYMRIHDACILYTWWWWRGGAYAYIIQSCAYIHACAYTRTYSHAHAWYGDEGDVHTCIHNTYMHSYKHAYIHASYLLLFAGRRCQIFRQIRNCVGRYPISRPVARSRGGELTFFTTMDLPTTKRKIRFRFCHFLIGSGVIAFFRGDLPGLVPRLDRAEHILHSFPRPH